MNIIEKQAFFMDYNNQEQYAEIRISEGVYIGIRTFDLNNNPTGYMSIFFHPNKRLYLDTIYCYDQFRKSGIATLISELADYILKDYNEYVIRGVYEPGQLSTDRENNIKRSKEELDIAARKFYAKNEYEVVEYENYHDNKDKYPFLTDKDFYLGEGGATTIVTKQIIKKDYSFYEENGTIYHNNYIKSNFRKI